MRRRKYIKAWDMYYRKARALQGDVSGRIQLMGGEEAYDRKKSRSLLEN